MEIFNFSTEVASTHEKSNSFEESLQHVSTLATLELAWLAPGDDSIDLDILTFCTLETRLFTWPHTTELFASFLPIY